MVPHFSSEENRNAGIVLRQGNIDIEECPEGTRRFWSHNSKYALCYCEPHCRWDKCRLQEAPVECLIGTNSIWLWDSQEKYWVAQVQGTVNYITKCIIMYVILITYQK